jgi:predicted dehydrogenase
VQVVNITTPNYLHREIAEAAAAAGKHIFCEKPVGRSPNETAVIAAAAQRAGVLTWVGYNYRWAPVVQYARNLVRDGKLGTITHYRGRFLVDYGSHPDGVLSWRFQRELAGTGTLGDLMSHVLDMAHSFVGPIERIVGNRKTFIASRPLAVSGEGTHFSVQAQGPRGAVTNEDYVGALVRFRQGAQGTLEVCRVVKGPRCEMAFELNGTKGALKWNFERMNELELFLPDGTPEHDGPVLIQSAPQHPSYADFYPGPANSMSYEDLKLIETYQFVKSIRNGKQAEPGFEEALRVAEVQAAVERSWDSERWEEVRAVSPMA